MPKMPKKLIKSRKRQNATKLKKPGKAQRQKLPEMPKDS